MNARKKTGHKLTYWQCKTKQLYLIAQSGDSSAEPKKDLIFLDTKAAPTKNSALQRSVRNASRNSRETVRTTSSSDECSCYPTSSMLEMPHAGKDHGEIIGIGGLNHLVIPNGTSRLNNSGDTSLCGSKQTIGKGEKGIGGHN